MQKELLARVHQDCFLLGKSSSQILPWTRCVLLSASSLCSSIPVRAAHLVLLDSNFLGQLLYSSFPPPWCQQHSQACSGVWKWLQGWSRLGPCWMLCLHILPSIPAWGMCCSGEHKGFAVNFSWSGVWNQSLLLKLAVSPATDWLAGCFALVG